MDRKFHGIAMVQYHLTDDHISRDSTSFLQIQPLFLHANSPKLKIAYLFAVYKVFYQGTVNRTATDKGHYEQDDGI